MPADCATCGARKLPELIADLHRMVSENATDAQMRTHLCAGGLSESDALRLIAQVVYAEEAE